MSVSLLQPSFFMLKTKSYAQILIGFWWFLTAMAIYLSIWVAPSDFQQGENYRIIYVHVPAAWMSILVYIAAAINSFLFLLTKHPLFPRFSGTGTEIGAFSTLFTLVTGGFWGKPMWGTFRVWDARLTSVFISFFIYPGAPRFQKLSVEPAPISICVGPINIPIIKFSANRWNASHQPGSISQSGTSIHVSMLIPILFNFANFFFLTCILFVLETRLLILSFLESSLTEEIEAREVIQKPSSLAVRSKTPGIECTILRARWVQAGDGRICPNPLLAPVPSVGLGVGTSQQLLIFNSEGILLFIRIRIDLEELTFATPFM